MHSVTFPARRLAATLLFTAAFLIVAPELPSDEAKAPDTAAAEKPVLDFTKAAVAERDKTANACVAEREAMINALLNQLEAIQKSKAEGSEHIIYLLGEMRATRAMWLLTQIIDYKATMMDPALRIRRWSQYPAAEALAKIGVPAARWILHCLPAETNATRRELMGNVLYDSLGSDFALFALHAAFDKETDAAKKANLQAAIDLPIFKVDTAK